MCAEKQKVKKKNTKIFPPEELILGPGPVLDIPLLLHKILILLPAAAATSPAALRARHRRLQALVLVLDALLTGPAARLPINHRRLAAACLGPRIAVAARIQVGDCVRIHRFRIVAEPLDALAIPWLHHHQLHRLVDLLDFRLLGPLLPEVRIVDRDVGGGVGGGEGGLGEGGSLLLLVGDGGGATREDVLDVLLAELVPGIVVVHERAVSALLQQVLHLLTKKGL
jgi:hypothetical protein